MDKVTVTLKPCPFCGGEGYLVERNYSDDKADAGNAYVECRQCGAESAWRLSASDAAHYWNTRQAEEQIKLLRGLVEEAFLEGYALGGRPRDANRSWEQSDSRQALEATNG